MLLFSVRIGLRALWRSPAYTLSVVVCIAVAIAANAAMYGVVDRLLSWQPRGVRAPREIARIWTGYAVGGREPSRYVFDGQYTQFAAMQRGAGLNRLAGYTLQDGTIDNVGARTAHLALVSQDYFVVLDHAPARGRTLVSADDGANRAVISFSLWKHDFAASDSILGRIIRIDGLPFEVIGVASEGFTGVEPTPVDAWVPLTSAAPIYWGHAWQAGETPAPIRSIVRFGTGDALEPLARRLASYLHSTPTQASNGAEPRIKLAPLLREQRPDWGDGVGLSLWLLAMAGVVMVVACVNVANLLLSRAAERQDEMAVHVAIGASRWQLLGFVGTELMLLVSGGLLVAAGLLMATDGMVRELMLPKWAAASSVVSIRTLAITVAALVSTLVLAVMLSWRRLIGIDPAILLRHHGSSRGSRALSTGRTLLALQAAAAVMLASEAGVFAASLRQASAKSVGLDMENVVVVDARLPRSEWGNGANDEVFRSLSVRVSGVRGVVSSGSAEGAPFGVGLPIRVRTPRLASQEGIKTEDTEEMPRYMAVSGDYFRTLGIALRSGRYLDADDAAGAPLVVVVNETLARMLVPSGAALGECVQLGSSDQCRTVVGVVRNHRVGRLVEGAIPILYLPLDQRDLIPGFFRSVFLRAPNVQAANQIKVDVERQLAPVRGQFQTVTVTTVADLVAPQARSWRLGTLVFSVFALIAIVLTVFGVYGTVLNVTLAQRREMAIRAALGASRAAIVKATLNRTVLSVSVGAAAGVVLSLVAGRFVSSTLFGVQETSLLASALSAMLVLGSSVGAGAIPTLRASAADPAVVLRAD